MKAWFAAPVTRAEAAGFALAVPVLWSMVFIALNVKALFDTSAAGVATYPELASPSLALFMLVGWPGCVAAMGSCALLVLLAVATRQPPWVRIAAPLLGWLLCQCMAWQVRTAFRDHEQTRYTLHGDGPRAEWLRTIDEDFEREHGAAPEDVPAPEHPPVTPR